MTSEERIERLQALQEHIQAAYNLFHGQRDRCR
jgi:hypothetical protein